MGDPAQELVACPEWAWKPGMLVTFPGAAHPLRLSVEVMPHVWYGSDGSRQDGAHCLQGDVVLVLADDGTGGVLLGMLADAQPEDVTVSFGRGPVGAVVSVGSYGAVRIVGCGANCGEAAALALLHVWKEGRGE